MSSDLILKDHLGNEYSLENIRTLNWIDGQGEGVNNLIGRLRTQSGEAYAAGQDDRARWLRGLAEELLKDVLDPLLKEHFRQKTDHPEIIKHVTGEGL